MSTNITYFVHGTTTDNEKKLATGWSHGELSAKGIGQSKELGKLVDDQYFDVVFCSDLKRAIDSAEFAFGDKYKILQDKRLRECNYGDFNEKIKDWDIADYIDKRYPGGESYFDVQLRISDFLSFLSENYTGKNVAIVAHQAPQLALDVLLDCKTWPEAIETDWRKQKAWKPGWKYFLE